MSVTITKAENGWIVTVSYDSDAPETWVYGGDDDTDDVAMFANALRLASDLIGPATSRYDAKRVSVHVEPGDKYEEGGE